MCGGVVLVCGGVWRWRRRRRRQSQCQEEQPGATQQSEKQRTRPPRCVTSKIGDACVWTPVFELFLIFYLYFTIQSPLFQRHVLHASVFYTPNKWRDFLGVCVLSSPLLLPLGGHIVSVGVTHIVIVYSETGYCRHVMTVLHTVLLWNPCGEIKTLGSTAQWGSKGILWAAKLSVPVSPRCFNTSFGIITQILVSQQMAPLLTFAHQCYHHNTLLVYTFFISLMGMDRESVCVCVCVCCVPC